MPEQDEKSQALEQTGAGAEGLEAYRPFILATLHDLGNEMVVFGIGFKYMKNNLPEGLYDKVLDNIERAFYHADILHNRIRNILNLKDLKFSIKPVTVAKLIEKIDPLARSRIPSNVKFVIEAQSSAGSHIIETNLGQLSGVVLELIKNASRALGEEGGRIDVSVKGEEDNVVLSVKDNGPGIPEALREVILKEQVPSERGTGLGLHLSSKVIEALGGTLRLESTSSEGTVFSISLPVSHTQEEG